jgi:FixJ family two-component response regulator
MSGFTADGVLRRGVAEENVNFLQKPFTLTGLARAVQAALAGNGS